MLRSFQFPTNTNNIILSLFVHIKYMILFDTTHQFFPYIVFEYIIVAFCFLLTILTFYRWYEKKTKLRLMLFLFMGSYFLALGGTALGQTLNYLVDVNMDNIFIHYLIGAKFSVFFTAVGTLFFHFLSKNIFHPEKELNKTRVRFIFLFAAITMILTIIPTFDMTILLVGSIFMLFEALTIFVPTSIIAYHDYKKIESELRYGLYFLFLTAVLFIVLWLIQISNQIWDLVTDKMYGPFWYAHWALVITILFIAYLGFILPAWFRKFVKKRIES